MDARDVPGVGVLSAVGRTPLVELVRLLPGSPLRVYAKLEAANPGGSVKDRPAAAMLADAVRRGLVVPGTSTVVESSSGNLGIGLAQACRYLGVRFVCVVDPRTNAQNTAVMRALGAEVHEVSTPDPVTGEYLPVRVRKVRELVARIPHAYWPNQYANPANAAAHRTTMAEVVEQLGRPPDYLFCAVSSCGTLRGCAEHVRDNELPVTIIGVDAEGSGIVRPAVGGRLLPGHGAATPPALYDRDLAAAVVHVSDRDAVAGCRTLARREALLAGGSSGAIVAALHRLAPDLPPGTRCALVLPDDGGRYLDTIYDDAWVTAHFGRVEDLRADNTMEVVRC